MSRFEVLHAYLSGRITQRAFVRALVALGVSLSAASVYASMLTPTKADPANSLHSQITASGPTSSDFYDDF